MPFYRCECCNFSSSIKTHYTKHIATPKHIELSSQPPKPVEDDPLAELSEFLCEELMALKNSINYLKESLQECKQLIMEMKYTQPTHIAPTQATPHSIVISQAPPPEPEEKKEDETCNPVYIVKKLNADPKYDNTPDMEKFFSIYQDHVHFDFDFEDLEDDVISQGTDFLVQHVIKFVKEGLKEEVVFPFLFYKSSWYVKRKEGWERQEKSNNKGIKPEGKGYIWAEPCRSFIFIFANRFNAYCAKELPDTAKIRTQKSDIWDSILARERHNEKTIQHPLRSLLTVNTI